MDRSRSWPDDSHPGDWARLPQPTSEDTFPTVCAPALPLPELGGCLPAHCSPETWTVSSLFRVFLDLQGPTGPILLFLLSKGLGGHVHLPAQTVLLRDLPLQSLEGLQGRV